MAKHTHEIRDPIHMFVRVTSFERQLVDTRAFQRLRHIHQLALTYLIYPGATHKRFEHSLGVMELATRVYDVVTDQRNHSEKVTRLLPELEKPDALRYWRQVLRFAALCHDLGHLPFSHAAEKELLPAEWTHETLSQMMIEEDPELSGLWNDSDPPVRPEDVVKLALGPAEAPQLDFSNWETVLAEIITGDAFGVDRMDYLLRDSHHAGVAYGKFDHYRLIDTMRILPSAPSDTSGSELQPALGVEEGGLHSVEALMYARYFMFTQLYLHPIRRIYDLHLKEFLQNWLQASQYSTELSHHLDMSDCEVNAGLRSCLRQAKHPAQKSAERIVARQHFRRIYSRNPEDQRINPQAGALIAEALAREFGHDNIRRDAYTQKGSAPDFPVRFDSGQVVSSLAASEALITLPVAAIDFIYVEPTLETEATQWLEKNRQTVLQQGQEREDDET